VEDFDPIAGGPGGWVLRVEAFEFGLVFFGEAVADDQALLGPRRRCEERRAEEERQETGDQGGGGCCKDVKVTCA
jgi:hypothetical protein